MSLILSFRDHLKRDVDLILASQSPRRREILDMMGLAGLYTVQPSPLNESALQLHLVQSNNTQMTPQDYTMILAQEKAKALATSLTKSNDEAVHVVPTLVLGSDTIVDLNGMILEKPQDKEAAKTMLMALSSNSHKVHTAVALYHVVGQSCTLVGSFVDTALVTFVSLQESDIMSYIETTEPMDKAGAYGIQGMGGQFVESITGDFFSVMGLPMHRTSQLLTKGVVMALTQ